MIYYIKIRFETSRPARMELYKKTNESSDWQPFQYYSYDCEKHYGLRANVRVLCFTNSSHTQVR